MSKVQGWTVGRRKILFKTQEIGGRSYDHLGDGSPFYHLGAFRKTYHGHIAIFGLINKTNVNFFSAHEADPINFLSWSDEPIPELHVGSKISIFKGAS